MGSSRGSGLKNCLFSWIKVSSAENPFAIFGCPNLNFSWLKFFLSSPGEPGSWFCIPMVKIDCHGEFFPSNSWLLSSHRFNWPLGKCSLYTKPLTLLISTLITHMCIIVHLYLSFILPDSTSLYLTLPLSLPLSTPSCQKQSLLIAYHCGIICSTLVCW